MFYGGSISPPREPPKKKYVVSRKLPAARKMGEGDIASASGSSGVREGSLMWPMLTRTNYAEWAMLMQCNFEAMEIWEVIEPGGAGVKRSQDRQAMSGLLRSVPREMWQALGSKKNCEGSMGGSEADASWRGSREGSECPETST